MGCFILCCTGWRSGAGLVRVGRPLRTAASANIIRLKRTANGRSTRSARNGRRSMRFWRRSGRSNMFDLEEAIRNWRRQMTGEGIRNADLLNELESHLRDDVEQQVGSGTETQQAFERAIGRIGQADALKSEFAKFSRRKSITKRAMLAFAGAGDHYGGIAMNTPQINAGIERAWVTY